MIIFGISSSLIIIMAEIQFDDDCPRCMSKYYFHFFYIFLYYNLNARWECGCFKWRLIYFKLFVGTYKKTFYPIFSFHSRLHSDDFHFTFQYVPYWAWRPSPADKNLICSHCHIKPRCRRLVPTSKKKGNNESTETTCFKHLFYNLTIIEIICTLGFISSEVLSLRQQLLQRRLFPRKLHTWNLLFVRTFLQTSMAHGINNEHRDAINQHVWKNQHSESSSHSIVWWKKWLTSFLTACIFFSFLSVYQADTSNKNKPQCQLMGSNI